MATRSPRGPTFAYACRLHARLPGRPVEIKSDRLVTNLLPVFTHGPVIDPGKITKSGLVIARVIAARRRAIATIFRLVDLQFTTAQSLIVECSDSRLALFLVGQGDKGKPAGFASLPIVRAIELEKWLELGKGFAEFVFRDVV